MPIDEFGNVTDPLSGTPSGDAGTPANPLAEENQKLKQKNAQAENLLQQARPLVDLARKLWNAPGGREVIEKLQNNQPLTAAEANQLDQQSQQAGVGITREELRDELNTFEQKQWEAQKAERAMSQLHQRASKELGEGYDNIAGSPQWNAALNTVLNMMRPEVDEAGQVVTPAAIQVPESEDDPYFYAVKYAYGYLTGNPPTEETTEKDDKGDWQTRSSSQTEDKRRAAIAAQSSKPAGAPTDDKDPDHPDLAWAKSRGSATIGKSFANG